MDPRYARPASPGSRRLATPARSSTGTLMYPSSYDLYSAPTRTSRDSIPNPRSGVERIGPTRIITKPYRDEGLPVRKLRDEYQTRPRRSSFDMESAPVRQPLGVVAASSPNRSRPVITSGVDKSSGPFGKTGRTRDDDPYYILPSSTSSRRDHRRVYSADNEDIGRLTTGERESREKMQRGGYRSSDNGSARSGYDTNAPFTRQAQTQDDRTYGYECTDRREQMYRDTAPRTRPRRDSYSGGRDRPLSMTGMEDYLPRVPPTSRDAGPPVSMTTRGYDALGRAGSVRQDYRPRESDMPSRDYATARGAEESDVERSRRSTRPSVALHQDRNDLYRENYNETPEKPHQSSRKSGMVENEPDRRSLGIRVPREDELSRDLEDKPRRHREKSHRRDRDEFVDNDHKDREEQPKDYRENPRIGEGLALGAAGAAAGVAAQSTRHRHRRDREPREGDVEGFGDRVAVNLDPSETTSLSGETTEEERRERRRRRRREREAKEHATQREGIDPTTLAGDGLLREQGPHERGLQSQEEPKARSDDTRRHHRHRRHHQHTQDQDSFDDQSSDDSSNDHRASNVRQVRVVTPSQEREPEPPIKGILRPPREKFPEDPAPVREGVAPLKDAGKKGIPPNARWTKIDRKLVNPEALLEGNERIEERAEYVIVLRVLTKEEIQEYAQRTQEIRGKRTFLDGSVQRAILTGAHRQTNVNRASGATEGTRECRKEL